MSDKQRAAIYTRVSTVGQSTEDKTSLAEQLRACEALAESRGLTVEGRYQDIASGVSRNRPGFQQLQADARAGAVDVILAWNADRLARSGSAMGDLLDAVDFRGRDSVRIETTQGTFDRRYAELLASIARLEREHILERTMQGKRGSARQGRLPSGKPPFGLRRGAGGLPEIVESEAEIVRRLFDLYANERIGVPAIRKILKAEYGFKRTMAYTYLMLRNTAFAGLIVYQGIEIPVPRIVDAVTWERTQDSLTKNRIRGEGNQREFFLLKHLFHCVGCGRMMGCRTQKIARITYRWYRYYGWTEACRERPYVKAQGLEDRVWSEVTDVLRRPDLLVSRFNAGQDKDTLAEDIRAAQREVQKWTMRSDRLISLFTAGDISKVEFDRQRKFVREPLEACQERLERLREQQANVAKAEDLTQAFLSFAAEYAAKLDRLGDAERRKVLREVVESATLNADNRPRYQLRVPAEPKIYASSEEMAADGVPVSIGSSQS